MHVLIAPDCFTGTLTATQAAEAMATGWRRRAPDDLLTLVPLSDGGPGFLDVITTSRPGDSTIVTVSGPRGGSVPAVLHITTDEGGTRTAWVESAQAIGLHLLDATERDPRVTTTHGLGELLDAALAQDVQRIVVGLGGSGTNDAGAGMLAALGARPREALSGGGAGLIAVREPDLAGLAAARERFAGVELVAATDVASPLLGLQGASAVFSEQKGATPEEAQVLEGALGHFADVVRRVLPPGTDLLTGRERRLDREPGAGAAGGVGYALLLLGGRRVSGVETVLSAVGLERLVAAADLVITGEGCLDWQSLQGKVVAGVAELASAHATPAVALAGQVLIGRREAMAMGLAGSYAVADKHADLAPVMADPVGTLADRAERVAATWSPRR
ncbi:glycerate kinase [Janibacter sp. YB324]|uniref:glycerate kinase family protein n=1 Tax=Janibacter sp. YB324 TaxID=2761047 RepID=UPI001623E4FD|nr:glycerate kinase [Janibacter sp. YB324]QNF95428.1 glycerate kinase [Janibacter sp. YB324]